MGKTRNRIRKGTGVVATPGRLDGAGPMDRLEVTKVHSDGTLDLELSDVPPDVLRGAWLRVDPDDVTVLG